MEIPDASILGYADNLDAGSPLTRSDPEPSAYGIVVAEEIIC
jgi:hypothetical protein